MQSKVGCAGHPHCPMTMGYAVGANQYICWLHALFSEHWKSFATMKLVAFPKQENSNGPSRVSLDHGAIRD